MNLKINIKKILNIMVILFLLFSAISTVYGASCVISLKPLKAEVKKDEELVVNVELSNIKDKNGIIAMTATLEYDKDSLQLVKMEGKNWTTPYYNEANGKIAVDRNGFATVDETMFTIIFKVKQEKSLSTKIILKNIMTSNAIEDIEVTDTISNITINNRVTPSPDSTPDPTPNPNPGTDNNGNNNGSGNHNGSNNSNTENSGNNGNGSNNNNSNSGNEKPKNQTNLNQENSNRINNEILQNTTNTVEDTNTDTVSKNEVDGLNILETDTVIQEEQKKESNWIIPIMILVIVVIVIAIIIVMIRNKKL